MSVGSANGVFPRGRLWGWLVLVGVVALLNYATRFAVEDEDGDRQNLLYEYSTAISGAVFYLILLSIIVFLARGLPAREVFALRRPAAWGSALLKMLVALAVIWGANVVLTFVLDLRAGDEQGIVPEAWEPDRAGAFVANFIVIAFFGPIVEELSYRGFGYWAVRAVYGLLAAVLVTSIMFGLSHGLVAGLPALTVFGLAAAWLRRETDSIYPSTLMHVFFNGTALLAAVTLGTEL
jgi:membrane protease YdiL (CAAX protease family)